MVIMQKIIEELEKIPYENQNSRNRISQLARAYANIAEPSDRELFKKAIDLLVPHEEYFEGELIYGISVWHMLIII